MRVGLALNSLRFKTPHFIRLFGALNDDTIIMESADSTLGYVADLSMFRNAHLRQAVILQILQGLAVASSAFDFAHNDLHANNVMLVCVPSDATITYTDPAPMTIPLFGVLVRIIDFGESTMFKIPLKKFRDVSDVLSAMYLTEMWLPEKRVVLEFTKTSDNLTDLFVNVARAFGF